MRRNTTVKRLAIAFALLHLEALICFAGESAHAQATMAGLVIRPELRYDRSLNDTRPFNDSTDHDQFTAGIDFILSF